MQRVVIAILAVVALVLVIVVIARQSSDTKELPAKPAPTAANSPAEAGIGEHDAMIDPDEAELEVKELSFGDGSANQRSIRIEGGNVELIRRVRDWLEPRESAAVSSRAAIDCHTQLAKTNLVSVVCVTLPAGEPDADIALDASAAARYESLTLRVVGPDVKELSLQDVLAADAGQTEVVAACKKTATPPTPCAWPPTAFAVGSEGALFLCHDSSCVTIEGDASLVKPELR